MTSAETKSALLNETVASFHSHGSCLSDGKSSQLTEKAELEAKVRKLEADLSEERKHSFELQEDVL